MPQQRTRTATTESNLPAQRAPRRAARWLAAPLAIAAICTAAWAWRLAVGESSAGEAPELQADGNWEVAELPEHAGTWLLQLALPEVVVIDPAAKRISLRADQVIHENPAQVTLRFRRGHPVLGNELRLVSQSNGVWLLSDPGAARAQRREH